MWAEAEKKAVSSISALFASDPNVVNAYMYQPGAGSGQAAQQGQAVPTTTPAYSSYQPAATQGYQASESSCCRAAGGQLSAEDESNMLLSELLPAKAVHIHSEKQC